jgi:hypothetical protein
LAALVHAAQPTARDDIAEKFCRRVATLTKRARVELEALKEQHRAVTEKLIAKLPLGVGTHRPGRPGRRPGSRPRQADDIRGKRVHWVDPRVYQQR